MASLKHQLSYIAIAIIFIVTFHLFFNLTINISTYYYYFLIDASTTSSIQNSTYSSYIDSII
jgi:hypothetical protein